MVRNYGDAAGAVGMDIMDRMDKMDGWMATGSFLSTVGIKD
jgi:hypothetical protein